MVIADEHIVEFQALYKQHFGVDLTKAQALEKGLRLIRLIEAVYRPDVKKPTGPLSGPASLPAQKL
jgi:hypothetical protein